MQCTTYRSSEVDVVEDAVDGRGAWLHVVLPHRERGEGSCCDEGLGGTRGGLMRLLSTTTTTTTACCCSSLRCDEHAGHVTRKGDLRALDAPTPEVRGEDLSPTPRAAPRRLKVSVYGRGARVSRCKGHQMHPRAQLGRHSRRCRSSSIDCGSAR